MVQDESRGGRVRNQGWGRGARLLLLLRPEVGVARSLHLLSQLQPLNPVQFGLGVVRCALCVLCGCVCGQGVRVRVRLCVLRVRMSRLRVLRVRVSGVVVLPPRDCQSKGEAWAGQRSVLVLISTPRVRG